MCGNPARTDVGGGRAAMTVPTALHFETYRVRPKAGRVDEHGNHGVAVGTACSSSSRFGPSSQAPASDGCPFKCLQRRIDVGDVESAAQAAGSASRAFETLYGCPWKLHADSIEVIAAEPPIGAGQPSNIRAACILTSS